MGVRGKGWLDPTTFHNLSSRDESVVLISLIKMDQPTTHLVSGASYKILERRSGI